MLMGVASGIGFSDTGCPMCGKTNQTIPDAGNRIGFVCKENQTENATIRTLYSLIFSAFFICRQTPVWLNLPFGFTKPALWPC